MLVPNISLQSISIYPIKSTSGIELSNSWVEECGLSFDRRFVVATLDGEVITARTEARLCLIQANLTATGLNITAPGMPILSIEYAKLLTSYQDITVWSSVIHSQHGTDNYNQWFSRYLEKPCQLLFFGEKSERFVKNKNTQVGFADGYPLLLISQQSLVHLNQRLGRNNQVTMAHFRPNIVVEGCNAFEEDTWRHVRIGEVEFEVTKPSSRCVFTTINPLTAEINKQQEPLITLQAFRQVEDGEVMFGQNLVPLNKGQIKRGDTLEIIEKKKSPTFITKNVKGAKKSITKKTPVNRKPEISFSSWNKDIVGNNKDTILDQGENAGLIIPHSCRGGLCGHCKVKLESGDVRQSSTHGLTEEDQENNYILSCSSVPTSNIVVSKVPRKFIKP